MTEPLCNGAVSGWYAERLPQPGEPLPGDRRADVCIVGAGFTGLWTAYYLKRARPDLEVVVLEREFAGFGASGRNGGWLIDRSPAWIPGPGGEDAARRLKSEMRAAVEEVLAVCEEEGIDADIVRSGVIQVARTPAQQRRLDESTRSVLALDPDDGRVVWGVDELEQHVRVAGALGATWSPHGVRVQPAKLVRGLAMAAQKRGVVIYESTAVSDVKPHVVRSDRGTVTADVVITCLEGFTASLRGMKRKWLPLSSSMVMTRRLSSSEWERIGWRDAQLLYDNSHVGTYAQRTADGRIALGGPAWPYRYGSRTDTRGQTKPTTVKQVVSALHDLFPTTKTVPIAHAWSGVLGVPRDWSPTVSFDSHTRMGIAGGYVGSGLAPANLAGRTLRDLVLGDATPITSLLWVGHAAAKRWEPEPLRWTGTHLVHALYRAADRSETRTRSPRNSVFARAADSLSGAGH